MGHSFTSVLTPSRQLMLVTRIAYPVNMLYYNHGEEMCIECGDVWMSLVLPHRQLSPSVRSIRRADQALAVADG